MSWGAVIAAGGAIVGGVISNKGAKDAAASQNQATGDAIAEQRRQYDQTREDFAPWRQAGANALQQLAGDINAPVTAADVMQDPGYAFGAQQGQQAIDRKIAASGGRVSGQAIKAAARFGTDYASTGYGAAYQRRQDRLNRLAALAGIGQTATTGSAAAGAASSNAISSLLSSQGDATAAGQVARANIWGDSAKQLAALGKNYVDRQQNPFPQWGSGGGYGSGTGGMGD